MQLHSIVRINNWIELNEIIQDIVYDGANINVNIFVNIRPIVHN